MDTSLQEKINTQNLLAGPKEIHVGRKLTSKICLREKISTQKLPAGRKLTPKKFMREDC